MPATRVRVTDLPSSATAARFEGADHGGEVSFFLNHNPPGVGTSLHRHPYAETFIVQAGTATFTVDGATIEATEGDIVSVPPNTPHGFVNSGATELRQIGIHAAAAMETEWLE
jgi:quercetin dioxygenase-like cupin family protein